MLFGCWLNTQNLFSLNCSVRTCAPLPGVTLSRPWRQSNGQHMFQPVVGVEQLPFLLFLARGMFVARFWAEWSAELK